MSEVQVQPSQTFSYRSIREIIADLSQPVAARHLKTKRKGGATLSYIPWYHAIRYLDLYAPGWSSEVRSVVWSNEGRVIVVVRIQIPCAEGYAWREATGTEEEPDDDEKMYGNVAANAEAMALKRAAAKFGLGLSLYDKEAR